MSSRPVTIPSGRMDAPRGAANLLDHWSSEQPERRDYILLTNEAGEHSPGPMIQAWVRGDNAGVSLFYDLFSRSTDLLQDAAAAIRLLTGVNPIEVR